MSQRRVTEVNYSEVSDIRLYSLQLVEAVVSFSQLLELKLKTGAA